jgi:sulfonate transport system permease protein
MLVSLQRVALGLFSGIASGVVLALVAGLTRPGDALFDGLVQVKRAIPTLALIPLLIMWLGIGEAMKITIIALGVFVPIYLNTHSALKDIDTRYVELGQSVALSRGQFLRYIVMPGCLPGFFVGLRLAVAHAWTALVVVETINAVSGIGFMITQARIYGQMDIVLVGLIIYGVLGFTSDSLIRLAQRKALSWRQSLAF